MMFEAPSRLGASALIDLSEAAARMSPAAWSVALLRAGYPEAQPADICALPLGSRDQLVVALRGVNRGATFRAEPECPDCHTIFELSFSAEQVGYGHLPTADPAFQETEIDGKTVLLRPVTLADLQAVERLPTPEAAAAHLAEQVTGGRIALGPALSAALEARDPLADIWVSCTCAECGSEQAIAFDPVAFVAHEIRQMAQRILRDVVEIARVFHWSERDILEMPEARRAFYLSEALA